MNIYQVLAIVLLNSWYYANIYHLDKINKISKNEAINGIIFVVMMTLLLMTGKLSLYFSINIIKFLYDAGSTIVHYEASGHIRSGSIRKLAGNIICFISLIIFKLGV